MRGDLRRIWARSAARLLSRSRDRPRQARLGARPFLADAGADLAGVSADPASDAEIPRLRGFYGRAVSPTGTAHACAPEMTRSYLAASLRGGGADQRSAASSSAAFASTQVFPPAISTCFQNGARVFR